jgi:hypothetical protein
VFLFAKIPLNKFVYVDHVACDVRTDVSLVFATLGVKEADGSIPAKRYSPLKFVEGPAVTSNKVSFIDVEPRMRFTPGSRPRLAFQVASEVSSQWFVRCQLVGRVSTS